jgi:hypothetical protein
VVAGGGSGSRGARGGGQEEWRWQHNGSGEVLCTGGREQQGRRGGQRKKKGGRGPKGLCVKLKDSSVLSVKQNFPLI